MGNIKTTRYDIGAEVLSILTRGMYPDPKDTLREYIQNGVDAGASDIFVWIRKNTITVEDNGTGMDWQTLRKAAKVGVSEKQPGKDVGFMGIGIYSSFHLCDMLTIYTHKKDSKVYSLTMDFERMRAQLKIQTENRISQSINSEELIDLQSLLEENIVIFEHKTEEFPNIGTRIEMVGIQTEFLGEFSKYEELSNYLTQVVPLKFDELNFKWATDIEKKIQDVSQARNANFEMVNLFLEVENQKGRLYRPYLDSDFSGSNPLSPTFIELFHNNIFYGLIWGCLNSTRNKIENKDKRGFLLRKQGFAISNRRKLSKYVKPVYYDRYIGEVIVVNENLLPNAARNDFSYSSVRTGFYSQLGPAFKIAQDFAHEFQEYTLGDEQLNDSIFMLKNINNEYTVYEKDANKLINSLIEIRDLKDKISGRLKRKSIRPDRVKDARQFISSAKKLEASIENTIELLTKNKRAKANTRDNTPVDVQKNLSAITVDEPSTLDYESFIHLLDILEIQLSDESRRILRLVDERVIQGLADNERHYQEILRELKEEIEKDVI